MYIAYFIRRFIEIVFLGRLKGAMSQDFLYNGWINSFFIEIARQPAPETMNSNFRQSDS